MRIRHGFSGALALGLVAGVLRVWQYILVMDGDGYYVKSSLSSLLNGVLIGLLVVGLVWCIISGLYKKAEFSLPEKKSSALRVLFALLGVTAAADGLLRLLGRGSVPGIPGSVAGLCCLLGALGWFLLACGIGSKATALFPILQMAASVLSFFWATYKYIHVSEYALGLLGLCVLLLFTLVLMRAAAGAPVSKGRVQRWTCMTAVLAPTAFLAPVAGMIKTGLRIETVLLCAEGLLFLILAGVTVQLLQLQQPTPKGGVTGPDIAALDQYITDIPTIKEEKEDG